LTVLLTPTFLVPPAANIFVASNRPFAASAIIRGNPPPFRFEWREISTPRAIFIVNNTTNFYTSFPITNRAPNLPTAWRLVVSNEATATAQIIPAFFTVTSLADSDGDGIPDDWESEHGLDPHRADDALLDADQDGMNNYAEYLAGTNPTNAVSGLRVELEPMTALGTVRIRMSVLANHTYTLQASARLDGGMWSRVADLAAQPYDYTQVVDEPLSRTNRFYRLVTPRQ
jgi:hypothetical protein